MGIVGTGEGGGLGPIPGRTRNCMAGYLTSESARIDHEAQANDRVGRDSSHAEVRSTLAILSTHPIQYHAHWFRALARRPDLDLHVFYCYRASPVDQAEAGFGVEFEWDVPLLDGYRHTFLNDGGNKLEGFFAPEAQRITGMLAPEKFDALLVNGWHYRAAWQAIFACWKLRIPVLVRGDSQLGTSRTMLKRFLKYPAYRCFIPRFDACLAVGTRSRDYYLHYGAAQERVFLVPHAIQDDLFQHAAHRAQPRRTALRQQWGLGEQEMVFLFAGKFIEKKRPLDFVKAIAAALQQEPGIAGLMVGDGPLRVACEQFVTSHKLPIHFAGFLNQSRMAEAYVAADCLVLPSDGRETWGLVVNEAMSCSRPAVVSDAVGCAPDLVRDGRTGAVFPLGNVGELSKILVDLARDPSRVSALGARASADLHSYSVGAAVQGVVDALDAVTLNRRTK